MTPWRRQASQTAYAARRLDIWSAATWPGCNPRAASAAAHRTASASNSANVTSPSGNARAHECGAAATARSNACHRFAGLQTEAAIHVQDDAVDEGVARQKVNRTDDVLDRAEPARRRSIGNRRQTVAGNRRPRRRHIDEARSNRVDANTQRPELDGHRFRQPFDAGFC